LFYTQYDLHNASDTLDSQRANKAINLTTFLGITMFHRRRILSAAALGLTCPLSGVSVWAQAAFPSKPVKIVVPYAAGGGPDVLTRKLAPKLAELLGQNVVVENIVGAGGILAAQSVARAAPDGYTVILGSSTHITQKAMQPGVKFDPVKDFAHVLRTTAGPQLLVVAVDSPWKTAQELVAAVKASPGKFNFGSGGVGSAAHLVGAAVGHALQLQVVHVPYKGSVEIIPSILQGATQFGFPVSSTAIPMIQQGKVRALATSGAARLAQLPNVPTLREAFGNDDLALESWGGFWVPAGTPPTTIDVLFRAFQKVYADPAVRADNEAAGSVIALSASPAEFSQFVAQETLKYEKLVKATNLGVN
jgi:tripartite-type tricarboxylate transporter receptor subunit TctC